MNERDRIFKNKLFLGLNPVAQLIGQFARVDGKQLDKYELEQIYQGFKDLLKELSLH